MGFFYKAGGGGGGVTVVEGGSFDALATSAKSQDHGVLMLDTTNNLYYKNWKTGGSGIPVPVEYFDDVTGYLTNASGNCYMSPADSYADLTARGWVNFDQGTGTSTKIAGSDLVLDVPTSAAVDSRAGTWFTGTGTSHQQYLSIITISSFAPGSYGGSNHEYWNGLTFLWAADNTTGSGSTRLYWNLSLGASTNSRYTLYQRNLGGPTTGTGPNASFTSGTVITVADFSEDALSTQRGTTSPILEMSGPNVAATFGALGGDLFYPYVWKRSTETAQLTMNIKEIHILKI